MEPLGVEIATDAAGNRTATLSCRVDSSPASETQVVHCQYRAVCVGPGEVVP